jgi:hypothetical protein
MPLRAKVSLSSPKFTTGTHKPEVPCRAEEKSALSTPPPSGASFPSLLNAVGPRSRSDSPHRRKKKHEKCLRNERPDWASERQRPAAPAAATRKCPANKQRQSNQTKEDSASYRGGGVAESWSQQTPAWHSPENTAEKGTRVAAKGRRRAGEQGKTKKHTRKRRKQTRKRRSKTHQKAQTHGTQEPRQPTKKEQERKKNTRPYTQDYKL